MEVENSERDDVWAVMQITQILRIVYGRKVIQSYYYKHKQSFAVSPVTACGNPPKLPRAEPSVTFGQYGDVVTYNCKPGFRQTGGDLGNRTCNACSVWSTLSDDPVCERKYVVHDCLSKCFHDNKSMAAWRLLVQLTSMVWSKYGS